MAREDQALPVLDPPDGLFGSIRYLGPGLILSAAIVGSGELIATTSLGAKAGYAVATVAFYILGAAVLRPHGEVAEGQEVVWQLSRIFTEVLGSGTTAVFMIGAFMVLFSTLFSNVAGHSRLWIDFFCLCRNIDPGEKRRARWLTILVVFMPVFWALSYLSVKKAIALVVVLGITNSIFLLVVAYQALVSRYRHTDEWLRPSKKFDVLLWLSIITMGIMAARVTWNTYQDVFGA